MPLGDVGVIGSATGRNFDDALAAALGYATSAHADAVAAAASAASASPAALYASLPAAIRNQLDGYFPALVADVGRSQQFLSGAPVAADLSAMFTVSSASKRVIGPTGTLDTVAANTLAYDWSTGRRRLLVEALPATNLLLNSASLTSQTIAVSAGTFTLSFWGTATVTLSGAASGSVVGTSSSVRSSLTVAATSGSLTIAVSGAGTGGQLEAGSAATSYIPTTSAAVTRIADDVRLSAAALALANASGGATIALRGKLVAADNYARLLGDTSTSVGVMVREAASNGVMIITPGGYAVQYGGASLFSDFGACAAYSSSTIKISKMGVAPASAAVAFPTLSGLRIFGGSVGGYANGFVDEVVIWPFVGSNTGMQAQARVWA